MSEPKPLASLSAGLLARKGAARPAMRRQSQALGSGFAGQDDLGWNDMGYDVDPNDAAHDIGMAAGHGLSPMVSTMDTPSAASVVQPMVEDAVIAPQLDEPEVRYQQARLERQLAAQESQIAAPAPMVEAAVEAVVEAEAEVATPEPVATAPVQAEPAHAEPAQAEPVAPPVATVAPVLAKPVMTLAPAALSAPSPAAPVAKRASPPRAPRVRAGTRGNFAFTLRLDPDRHLRLRLASAMTNRSAQQILTALVDDYFANQPEIDACAKQVPASAGHR